MGWTVKSLVLAATTVVIGCSAVRTSTRSPFDPVLERTSPMVTDLLVEVQNEHWLSMRVWAEWPGARRFLGDVSAGSRSTFRVPRELLARSGTLRLRADPTGSADEVLSDPITVDRCSRVEWRLRKVLANSRARVM